MIGGGPNAFIGEVHRLAARMDNRFELVAGCFSTDYLKSKKIRDWSRFGFREDLSNAV
jgi:hypothetical protein